MRKLVNSGFKAFYKLRMKHIEWYANHPEEAQEKIFKQLIFKARGTEWGKKYHFGEIKTINAYAKKVPVSNYEHFKPRIEEMMRGGKDILWPGKIRWFSKSSGTTSDRSKYIPVSNDNLYRCHQRGNWDALTLLYNQRPDARIHEMKTLLMAGSLSKHPENSKANIGDVSAIMITQMPRIAIPFFAPNFQVALQSDFGKKIEQTAQITSQMTNIVSIGGVPTWTVVLFRRILEITGKNNILEVWPDFQCYIHGGVSFLPYVEQFQQFLPSDQVSYQEVYNASEGYFGIQNDFNKTDMLLLLDNGVYYEFVPMEEWGKTHPKAIPLSAVKAGRTYAMVISTNAGLWRYLIGDTVTFTSTDPYKIKITGRTKQYINAFGEEVMVENTDLAIAMTCRQTGAIVRDYTAAPIFMSQGKGGHEWFIEFEVSPQNYNDFAAKLDQNLQEVNSDYQAKRYKNMALHALQLNVVPKGAFVKWLKSKGKFSSQTKVPRLSNDRKFINEINGFLRDSGLAEEVTVI